MTHLFLATEDELSEEVANTLAKEAGLEVVQRMRRGGSGYLRSNVAKFCQLARSYPVLLLTDLDRKSCAPELLKQWLGRNEMPPNLLLRVAVREVESWLLADHVAMQGLLGAKAAVKLPREPDALDDPKRTLLALAENSSRSVRSDLVVAAGAIASQGIGYNSRLCAFVRESWQPSRAACLSPSLAKARARLNELARRLA